MQAFVYRGRLASTSVFVAFFCLITFAIACDDAGEIESNLSSLRERPDAPPLWGVAVDLQQILLDPDPLLRAESLAHIFRSLEPDALDEVLRSYDAVFLDLGEFELELLAEWWATFDPAAALEWSRDGWPTRHPRVSAAILRAWARSDPQAALRVAEQELAPKQRRDNMDAVLTGWAESGQPGALEFVESMGRGHDRQLALAIVARRKVLRDGPDAAIEWAESQPDSADEYKLNLFRRIASAIAEVDPLRAADWATTHFDDPLGNQLPQRVGTRWVSQDPEAAVTWFGTLPSGPNRDLGLQETYRMWLRDDHETASHWMNEQRPHEAWLDSAFEIFVYSLSQGDVAGALPIALEIHDQDKRWAAAGRVWRAWYFKDQKAAEEWFAATAEQIPDFYRKRIPIISPSLLKAAGIPAPAVGRARESSVDNES